MRMTWNKIGISWRKTYVSGKEEKWLWEAVGKKNMSALAKFISGCRTRENTLLLGFRHTRSSNVRNQQVYCAEKSGPVFSISQLLSWKFA